MRLKRAISFSLAFIICFLLAPAVSASGDGVISVGKSYSVTYVTPIDNAYPKLAYSPETKLTDGKTAKAEYSDTNWLTLYRGTAVTVDIDLGETMAVSEVKIGELQLKSYGVLCSRYLKVYLSDDGETYYYIGEVNDNTSITSDTKKRVELDYKFGASYAARYIRAEFSSDIFTMVDEISVIGNSSAGEASDIKGFEIYSREPKGLASPVDGISSVSLMYISTSYTQEIIKPYVAYIDSDGNAQDKMFDSLLFLGLPAGVADSRKATMEDMQNIVSIIMGTSTGHNLTALENVIGSLKGSIYDEDYKYPVFISLPSPGVYSDVFGTVDGKKINASNLANRERIVDWYIDYTVEQFNACKFNNIELKGFYWFNEIIQYSISSDEEELVAHFNATAHEKGYKTLWIPYYAASGIDVIDKLGFDAVVMQSGYAFDGSDETGVPNPQACDDCAAAAELFGMGMEFEVDMNRNNYYDRFAQYVHSAYTSGVMENGIMMMYQVGNHLYQSAVGSAAIRNLYELTYKYCSKTYAEHAPVITSGATVTVKVGEYMNNKLEIIDEDTPLNQLKVARVNKPDGLYFSASGNGFFEIEAYRTEPGTYSASFSVTDGFNESNLVEITIIVEADDESAAEEEPSAEPSLEPSDETSADGTGIQPWVIAVIAVLAVLIIVEAVILTVKTKNKK